MRKGFINPPPPPPLSLSLFLLIFSLWVTISTLEIILSLFYSIYSSLLLSSPSPAFWRLSIPSLVSLVQHVCPPPSSTSESTETRSRIGRALGRSRCQVQRKRELYICIYLIKCRYTKFLLSYTPLYLFLSFSSL